MRVNTDEITSIYNEIRDRVGERYKLFKSIWDKGTGRDIFIEMMFCLLTPQSKATQAEKAIQALIKKDTFLHGSQDEISDILNVVRFKHHKASYIIKAREQFIINGRYILKDYLSEIPGIMDKRDWLVYNIKGIGYKEASHMLRNIGLGDDVAILDRHILKNMLKYGLIKALPKSLDKKNYDYIEGLLRKFSKGLNIPLFYMDYILWYKETGVIFK